MIENNEDKNNITKEEYKLLELLSHRISKWVSSSSALFCVTIFLIMWLALGPYMNFEENWHLLATTTSGAITFFMIFVLAREQAKDTMAIQIKLNEIIAALNGANNNLINIERFSEGKISNISKSYETVAEHIHNKSQNTSSVESIITNNILKELEECRSNEELKN